MVDQQAAQDTTYLNMPQQWKIAMKLVSAK